MFDKVNIAKIVVGHLNTLTTHSTGKKRKSDLVLFFVAPFGVGVGIVVTYGSLGQNLIGPLVTSLAVFTALLLNLLVLTYGIARNSKPRLDAGVDKMKGDLIREIFSNIAFTVLIALTTVVAVLTLGALDNCTWPIVPKALSLIVYYMGTLFLLTLLMLLKRTYALLSNEEAYPTNPPT